MIDIIHLALTEEALGVTLEEKVDYRIEPIFSLNKITTEVSLRNIRSYYQSYTASRLNMIWVL